VNRVRHVFAPEASAVSSAERLSLRLRPVVRQGFDGELSRTAHHPEEDRGEGSPSTRFLSSGGSGVLGGSLRAPFDAREATLQPQKACQVFDPEAEPQAQTRREPLDSALDTQAGKALTRKLSPRVEWWPQRDSNPRFRLERAFQTDLGTLTHVSN